MSEFSKELTEDVNTIVTSQWSSREGQVVPKTEEVGLGNDRVVLAAVLLYADLADSTEMAMQNQEIASEVFKSYLGGVTKIIRKNGGHIRSFDGDRVMGVFVGDYKNSYAARCALQINWFFSAVLVPEFKKQYGETVNDYNFNQTVGVDAGSVQVSRSGVRRNNDLIWVGRAPNMAAKMSSLRSPKFKSFITPDVYKRLQPASKVSTSKNKNMWTLLDWADGKKHGIPQIYGSEWTWTL